MIRTHASALTAIALILCASVSPAATYYVVNEPEMDQIAVDAYLYTYPLLVMDMTRRCLTYPLCVDGVGPANQFNHMRIFPKAGFDTVLHANVDTLYSSAWLDLRQGPVLVSVPDTAGRYYLIQMMDMWSDVFASVSPRTAGAGANRFLVTPPGWTGEIAADVTVFESPTPHVWAIARTLVHGRTDFENAHIIQDGYAIADFGEWSGKQKPAILDDPYATTSLPFRAVDKMSAGVFFKYASQLLRVNPPHSSDDVIIDRMTRLGFIAGAELDWNRLHPAFREALERAPLIAQQRMRSHAPSIGAHINGWQIDTRGIGVYGNDYLKRAVVAKTALGANAAEDAVYPVVYVDRDGRTLNGERNYIIHFERSQLPPVNAFWSIALYNAEGYTVANDWNRYAVGDQDPLRYNPDGSLDIFIENERPGDETEPNWIYAPEEPFHLMMRLYWPTNQVLAGNWAPPPVIRIP
ncbi:MAG: DUF1254 domain-containing protein [Candidatus Hydrogenedentes bacterium]|nr:DUF1254 domain-containing protein [Candidatus Hydrogenedentota bacterium]